MRLEGGFVAEQFVEQELRGIFLGPRDQEQFCAGLALCFGQKARQDFGNAVFLSFAGFPLRDHQQAAAGDGFADGSLVDGVSIHAGFSSLLRSSQKCGDDRYNSTDSELFS
jgi:hypothetical protein